MHCKGMEIFESLNIASHQYSKKEGNFNIDPLCFTIYFLITGLYPRNKLNPKAKYQLKAFNCVSMRR